jgi:hypothetical protein
LPPRASPCRSYNMFHQLHEDLRMEFSTAHCLCVSPSARSAPLVLAKAPRR